MSLKNFDELVKSGIVIKQSPSKARANSLESESTDKHKFLESAMKNIPQDQMNHNFIVESCYDIILELIRAKMFIDGFNSKNSHEAEVSYMQEIGFSEAEVRFMDEMRYNRNGIKYYGRQFDKDYSKKTIEFMNKLYPRLKALLKQVN